MTRSVLVRMRESLPTDGENDFAARAQEAGFDGVEMVFAAPVSCGCVVKAVSVVLQETDLDKALEETAEFLKAAAVASAICLNVTLPPLARSPGDLGFAGYQQALNYAYDLLHHMRHQAEKRGVRLALEAATNECLLSPVELREIIRSANSWAVGVCVDVNRVADVGRPGDWITILGGAVHAVRIGMGELSQASLSSTHVPFDLVHIREALDVIHFEGPVIVDGVEELASLRAVVAPLVD